MDALYAAAIAGDADARAKLEVEADRVLNDVGESILHVESKHGKTERVQFILREFANKNLLFKLGNFNETALTWAAYFGYTDVAKVLIDAATPLPDDPITSFHAFLRQGDNDMDTALHVAVHRGHLDVVRLLVEADPNYKHLPNVRGETPIYIAAEKGYNDIVNVMFTTCRAPSLDGPGGTTALHAAIKNLHKAKKEEDIDVIEMMIMNAVNCVNITEDANESDANACERLVQLYNKTDDNGCTILELAVDGNHVDVVELILAGNPAYGIPDYPDFMGLVPLIYKANDKKCTTDIVELLTQGYKSGARNTLLYEEMASLISAIRSRDKESVLSMLDDHAAKHLVTFADNLGWTALHHASYQKFDSVIAAIVEAQKKYKHQFVYQDKISTPFHVAAEKGYTSTVILLMQLWPSCSSAYTAVDRNGQNILHLAALQNNKGMMIQGILQYCHKEYKNEFVNKKDKDGNTPLHLLILRGCLVLELLSYEGLDLTVENKENLTPPDMLYAEDKVAGDQVQIKMALGDIQIDQKRGFFSSSLLSSTIRGKKDEILNKEAKRMKLEKYALIKNDTDAIANCFAEAIAGDPISRAALEMEAETLNEAGETMLHVESKKGNIENVRFIVKAFAKKSLLGKLDGSKQTALHLAAQHRDTQVVKALIDAAARHLPSSSANYDANNPVSSFQDFTRQANVPNRNTALHLAVLNGNVKLVNLLVIADPDDCHAENYEGKTPIYIAAENGYKDIVEEICKTCKALCLDGPGGRTTAIHTLIQNIGQVTKETSHMIRMMVQAAKRCWSSVQFEALFSRIDESRSTVLQLAVEKNYVDAVELILREDPAYQSGREIKRNALMCLIYKAIDNGYSKDIIQSLSEAYKDGIDPDHKDVLDLILAIQKLDEGSVVHLLGDAKHLVTFAEDNGWTPLHYAVYHEFDSILGVIIKAQKEEGHSFAYGIMELTPFYIAIKNGSTSTLLRLMDLWPEWSPAYTIVNHDGQNVLHLAAASDSRKDMVQGILKYCPKKYKDEILNHKDSRGDTPLHLLISHGCFIPGLIKHKGLDTTIQNNQHFTPLDILYLQDDIVADQVRIKIAIDDVQTNQSVSQLWGKRTEKKTDIWKCNKTTPSKRKRKDGKFEKRKKELMHEEREQVKKDLDKYKMRTNTQILVTALITTVTFTVGFTMPGGLHQSGEVDEGLVVHSRKRVFNIFMVSDALALLMSTSSLFFYFLESMNDDLCQVSLLNVSSTVLNILSIMMMMVTFISGTYVVLSDSPVLAIAVCIIGSLFFLLVIMLFIIKRVYDHGVKKNKY